MGYQVMLGFCYFLCNGNGITDLKSEKVMSLTGNFIRRMSFLREISVKSFQLIRLN